MISKLMERISGLLADLIRLSDRDRYGRNVHKHPSKPLKVGFEGPWPANLGYEQ